MSTNVQKITKKIQRFIQPLWLQTAVILILGILIGYFLFSGGTSTPDNHIHTDASDGTVWTCSMDPQVRLNEPGQCPICFMDLIPLVTSSDSIDPKRLSLSASAVELAQIQTSPVRRGEAFSTRHLSGKIDYDETKVKHIAAWFPGRLERLYVDYTGIQVKKGDHLLDIYSPELYSAQSELIQAYNRFNNSDRTQENGKIAQSNYETVKEKVKLLGVSDEQIDAIQKKRLAQSVLQVNSPIAGIVTHKNAFEGKYVKMGEQIYSIADLSKVWLVLDAYEQDLPWLTYGEKLTFTLPGLPGKSFSARISYIDPLVNPETRSITIRAVLDNKEGLLKPGMLAEAVITASLNAEGKVITPNLDGDWVCPMHPEVIETHPGKCTVCGMDLVPIEEISGISARGSEALLIPASAVLKTGKRALVYVQSPGEESASYELRQIVLGPRVGEEYIVLSGLDEGELVVSNGNFKIDSAMQIAGKQSMMSGSMSPTPQQMGHHHE
ncbi:MAG: efflux RND transporter periplasmic adaptor subunit [Candidatus Marinimicrobia bacterium]|nr:efflux RND transporter periplasmic adaptor subunit [Candidatus Neomarinimicrobiota bacterium]